MSIIICFRCGKPGHYANQCPRLTCCVCGYPGHYPRLCPTRYRPKIRELQSCSRSFGRPFPIVWTGRCHGSPQQSQAIAYVNCHLSDILYSQGYILNTFRDGAACLDLVEDLVYGDLLPEDVEPIRVVIEPRGIEGRMVRALDNRRLWAFKEAMKRGAGFRDVLIQDVTGGEGTAGEMKWKMRRYPSRDWGDVAVIAKENEKAYRREIGLRR